jgi:hypothetical protein
MELYLSNPNYGHAEKMCSLINTVLKNHPLGIDILTTEVLDNLVVKVEFKSGEWITLTAMNTLQK